MRGLLFLQRFGNIGIGFQVNAHLREVVIIRDCLLYTSPGHFQRGGSPCAYDRVLCTRLGATAARFVKEKTFGVMVGMVNGQCVPVPLKDVAGKLKSVPLDCDEIKAARQIGISFGD